MRVVCHGANRAVARSPRELMTKFRHMRMAGQLTTALGGPPPRPHQDHKSASGRFLWSRANQPEVCVWCARNGAKLLELSRNLRPARRKDVVPSVKTQMACAGYPSRVHLRHCPCNVPPHGLRDEDVIVTNPHMDRDTIVGDVETPVRISKIGVLRRAVTSLAERLTFHGAERPCHV